MKVGEVILFGADFPMGGHFRGMRVGKERVFFGWAGKGGGLVAREEGASERGPEEAFACGVERLL